ncbi:MAG: HAD hydrolase-like protein [Massiliimalia sp.]|jgi:phosphoglycolate phosphatase
MHYQTILFDLDGTLTDSFLGIARCAAYALADQGIQIDDLNVLRPFVGPPLKECFQEFYHMTSEEADRAVAKYRERYRDTGIFENELYEGIAETLHTLKQEGAVLGIASSKPQIFVERILKHFSVDQYFDYVVGCGLDGSLNTKAQVIHRAMELSHADPKTTILVGDRKYDALGAEEQGISFLGVLYGFGGEEELSQYPNDGLVYTPQEVAQWLISH